MKLVFAGSFRHYSRLVLQVLLEHPRIEVAGVITTPPRPAGRKQVVTPTPVHLLAEHNEVPVYTPETANDDSLQASLLPTPDILLSAGYGKLFSNAWLEWPKHGALNVHFSLLPAYRGANPAEWAILRGETQTGITLIEMSRRFDTGDILSQATLAIEPTDTRETLYTKLYQLAARQVTADLPRYLAGRGLPSADRSTPWAEKLTPRPQPADSPTPYARRFQRHDGLVAWPGVEAALAGQPVPAKHVSPLLATALDSELSAVGLERAIRALAGFPGVWTVTPTTRGPKRLKLLTAHLLAAPSSQSLPKSQPGVNLAKNRHNQQKHQHRPSHQQEKSARGNIRQPRLVLDQVQLDGRRPTSWSEIKPALKM